jgi:hypothetical protein
LLSVLVAVLALSPSFLRLPLRGDLVGWRGSSPSSAPAPGFDSLGFDVTGSGLAAALVVAGSPAGADGGVLSAEAAAEPVEEAFPCPSAFSALMDPDPAGTGARSSCSVGSCFGDCCCCALAGCGSLLCAGGGCWFGEAAAAADTKAPGSGLEFLRCALLYTRNPKTRGTYADSAGSGSGTKLLKVIRNRCGKVVPNAAPSTPEAFPALDLTGGGWNTWLHLGQKILTVSAPISSLRPTGRTGCDPHCTKGHVPKSFAAYCEANNTCVRTRECVCTNTVYNCRSIVVVSVLTLLYMASRP